MSEMRKTKDRELEYFYQEPLSVRRKNIKGKHYSLALQGGGVKGLAYIGAYNGLKKEADGTRVTSIIGSSAGGILGLAICCEMPDKQIE